MLDKRHDGGSPKTFVGKVKILKLKMTETLGKVAISFATIILIPSNAIDA
jgi:hypothetical protein